jgi:competence protein ComGC
MDRMEKKKRRKPEIGCSDVVKVVEPVMQRIEAFPLTKEEQTKSKEEPKEPTIPVVKKKRNSCFLC